MTDVITFFFQLLGSMWSVITQYWILSFAFMLAIISWIVDLINGTRD